MTKIAPLNRTIYLAKAVADARRNEPRNVGVIVCEGSNMLHRFREDIDEPATQNWVDYWDAIITRPQDLKIDARADAVMEYLLLHGSSNHYIEKAGEVALDLKPLPLGNETERLYKRLVA